MQFQSDLTGSPVIRPKITETTALGAAYLAGLAVGFWQNRSDMEHHWQADRTFLPQLPAEKIHTLIHGWNRAVKAAISWAQDR
jgi:glycerol kinase